MTLRMVLAALLPLTLAACSGDSDEPLPERTAPNGSVFNTADVRFAEDLLVQRADEMLLVDATVGRELSPALTRAVDDLRAFRTQEITDLTFWLTDWEQEIPETARDHVNAGHGPGELPAALDGLEGAAFEQAWAELFLAEVDDVRAITAAEAEDGVNPEALQLAAEIDAGYDEEVGALEALAD